MEGGDFLENISWFWKLYLQWGLPASSSIAFIILSINTAIMGENKDKTVQAHWIANVVAIVFYCLAIFTAIILWFLQPNVPSIPIVEAVTKTFK